MQAVTKTKEVVDSRQSICAWGVEQPERVSALHSTAVSDSVAIDKRYLRQEAAYWGVMPTGPQRGAQGTKISHVDQL